VNEYPVHKVCFFTEKAMGANLCIKVASCSSDQDDEGQTRVGPLDEGCELRDPSAGGVSKLRLVLSCCLKTL
jgi:hypothetical protein